MSNGFRFYFKLYLKGSFTYETDNGLMIPKL